MKLFTSFGLIHTLIYLSSVYRVSCRVTFERLKTRLLSGGLIKILSFFGRVIYSRVHGDDTNTSQQVFKIDKETC